jgi:4-diphosphocytidyl-2-C-methyl-D-erythritol kinase
VAAPLEFGDKLTAELADEFSLVCDDAAVPTDGSNLVLRAAEVFRRASGFSSGVRFFLEKRIPMGAGLGGGSSNAVAALRAMNQLAGGLLTSVQVESLAVQLGSDCPLFLQDGPVIMRGRGESIQSVPVSGAARITSRSVLVFKPAFSISTPWAFGQLAQKAPSSYVLPLEAENKLAAWLESDRPADELLFNNMEPPAFSKFPALPLLLERLRQEFGVAVGMSGSGSACFALLRADTPVSTMIERIRRSWGESAFVAQTRLQ